MTQGQGKERIISTSSINVTVTRLGGGFGGKGDQASHLATAATVAANKLNRPVRIWLPLEDNVKLLGKRNQYLFDYKVSIQSLLINLHSLLITHYNC